MAVLPSAEIATDHPWWANTASVPASLLPCCDHTPPLRVNTHAALVWDQKPGPPALPVFPSAEIATEVPCPATLTAPVPTSLLPSCAHTTPMRVNTHVAPAPELSPCAPTTTVLPSAEIATELPPCAPPMAFVATTF